LAYAYHSRGSAYAYLSEYRKAIVDFDQAIDLFNKAKTIDKINLALAYCDRGRTYKKLGDTTKATANEEAARAIGSCDLSKAFGE
jgi:tetratricopeptide (TPR) repeat protein